MVVVVVEEEVETSTDMATMAATTMTLEAVVVATAMDILEEVRA